MGVAQMHVQPDLFPAPAEQAWLWDDGDTGEPLLPDAEPALHVCVAVSGL